MGGCRDEPDSLGGARRPPDAISPLSRVHRVYFSHANFTASLRLISLSTHKCVPSSDRRLLERAATETSQKVSPFALEGVFRNS